MKFLKVAVMAAIAFAWSNALAFHSGGVAECEGCHTMHNSFEGSANTVLGGASGPYLLKGTDQSSTCLNCHASNDTGPSGYHIASLGMVNGVPTEMTPGGDFAWLTIPSDFTVRGTPTHVDGERRGHNIVAVDFGYAQDNVQTVAPGGTYPRANLHCSSCHDPHGKYRRFADGTVGTTGLPIFNSGSYTNSKDPIVNVSAVGVYRILGGAGYQPKSTPGFPFAAGAPDAVAPSTYNRMETTQAAQTVVAYGQGMSEWCANCHTNFHAAAVYASGGAGLRHPAGNEDKLTAAVAANYNAYVRSGIMTGTGGDASYSTLAPFENGNVGYAYLKAFGGNGASTGAVATAGGRSADGTKNVACVSCHRAHATGFESMLRFFYLNEFMTVTVSAADTTAQYDGTDGLNGTEGKIHQGFTIAQTAQMYYNRPATIFGPYARSYCNKCHAKD